MKRRERDEAVAQALAEGEKLIIALLRDMRGYVEVMRVLKLRNVALQEENDRLRQQVPWP